MRYSIEDTTLTNIGDALRRKLGETKKIMVMEEQQIPVTVISKTSNATGFNTFEGSYGDEVTETNETMTDNNGYLKYYVYKSVQIPGASRIKVKYTYNLVGNKVGTIYLYDTIQIAAAAVNNRTAFLQTSKHAEYHNLSDGYMEDAFENTDAITFQLSIYQDNISLSNRLGYYAEVWGEDENGNPLETKTVEVEVEREVANTFTPNDMDSAIDSMTNIPLEAYEVIGDCSYRFANNNWNWFVEGSGDKVVTKDITKGINMFSNSNTLNCIPFELNFKEYNNVDISNMFAYCNVLINVPKINNCKPTSLQGIFMGCYKIREIPDNFADTWDWSYLETLTSQYSGDRKSTFENCYSLRKFPMSFLSHGNPSISYTYSIYNTLFKKCYVLDEIVGLPIPHYNSTWTSNTFSNTVSECCRIKNMTFALQEDGSPYVVNWKSQSIDMSGTVGYATIKSNFVSYNSGITEDKEVKDDDTYQALKDDPDWFATKVEYSRYNHDSAVATINSLPDTSAYLASAGGTNTIKFKGTAGSATDGGAINTLTEEEIAVAVAKGWTVTLV